MEQTSNRGCKNRRQRQRWWWSWSAFAGNFKAEEWGGWGVVPFKAVRVGQQHKAGIALHFTFKRRRVRGRKDLQTCILPLPGAGGGIKRYVLRSGSATVSIATASPCKVCTCILCWIYSAALLMDSQFPVMCGRLLRPLSVINIMLLLLLLQWLQPRLAYKAVLQCCVQCATVWSSSSTHWR
ncbi:uncharacterized protein LOC124707098 isoform X6 [Lolium rigidum]|uniref:uncharacterized protein LOC124707098 isoform X6 n=1 Tax=Lolium rigidum TaxID=89674 RepID=UPI001F5DBE4E|nr:uncharacterized protein LOC124707098 isoform X6 [Lolium rigidum]